MFNTLYVVLTSELVLRDFSLLRFAGGIREGGDVRSELEEEDSCRDNLREVLGSGEISDSTLNWLHH